jgi:hypothetical protein
MFFFNYLRRELTRRAGRTFLTVAGCSSKGRPRSGRSIP